MTAAAAILPAAAGPHATLDVALLLFFFLFFLAVIVWLTTRRRGAYDRIARLPLGDDAAAGGGPDRVEGRGDER